MRRWKRESNEGLRCLEDCLASCAQLRYYRIIVVVLAIPRSAEEYPRDEAIRFNPLPVSIRGGRNPRDI